MLYRHSNALLSLALAAAVTAAQTGTSKSLRGFEGDSVLDSQQSYVAVFEITATGGTSPTVDASVETSWDGTSWHTVASMTQMTAAGTKNTQKAITEALGPYVRCKLTPGGTAAPSTYGTIRLVSNAPYALS